MEFVCEENVLSFCLTISTHHFTTHKKPNLIPSATFRKCNCGISSWTNRTGNEGLLQRFKEARNILPTIKRRKGKLIDHILGMNCALKHIIEGRMEGRIEVNWRSRHKQVLDDFRISKEYWKLKQKTADRTQRKTRFGSRYGPVVLQTIEWIHPRWCKILFMTYNSACVRTTENHRLDTTIDCLLWPVRYQTSSFTKVKQYVVFSYPKRQVRIWTRDFYGCNMDVKLCL